MCPFGPMTILDADTVDSLFEVTAPNVDNPADLIGDVPVETTDGEIVILPRFEPAIFRFLFIRIIVSGIDSVIFGYEISGVPDPVEEEVRYQERYKRYDNDTTK